MMGSPSPTRSSHARYAIHGSYEIKISAGRVSRRTSLHSSNAAALYSLVRGWRQETRSSRSAIRPTGHGLIHRSVYDCKITIVRGQQPLLRAKPAAVTP